MEKNMIRRGIGSLLAALLLFFTANGARTQANSLAEQMIGSWALVSTRTTRADGSVYTPYGPHETGTLIFERNGRFAIILIDPDTPKFASNNREMPTAEEALAAAKGSFAFFGNYTVNEADRTFAFHVEASSFPNFNGTDQKRVVESITASELTFVNLVPPNGGAKVRLTYRRAN
jgi:hypothetical protein